MTMAPTSGCARAMPNCAAIAASAARLAAVIDYRAGTTPSERSGFGLSDHREAGSIADETVEVSLRTSNL